MSSSGDCGGKQNAGHFRVCVAGRPEQTEMVVSMQMRDKSKVDTRPAYTIPGQLACLCIFAAIHQEQMIIHRHYLRHVGCRSKTGKAELFPSIVTATIFND